MSRIGKDYAKWARDERGELVSRYSAIDPADQAAVCSCGDANCPRSRLLPFRTHIAELHRVIVRMNMEEIATWEPSRWSSTLYALRMAASIEDIEADTGHVEEPMVFAMCEPAIDFERGRSEMASKYVAAVMIFNFVWQAYEAIVSETAPDELVKLGREQRNGERGRRLLEARPQLSAEFPGIDDLVANAMFQCRHGGLMDDRCDRVEAKFGVAGLVAAAELAREFRNFAFHGGDEAPGHADWGEDETTAQLRVLRYYSIARLLLHLVQAMAWIIHEGDVRRFEYGSDDDEMTACQILTRLQFKGPGIWPPIDQRDDAVA
ncbi:MAG: hypothetical protein V4459_08465 [Pseudomonadota bacterium]